MALGPGLNASVTLVVGDDDTALAARSGDVPVLATPRIVALVEEATCAALDGHLQPGETTVGVRVQLDHLAPTAVDGKVVAEATLESVQGKRLTFTVTANDAQGLIAAGKVTRVVVDRLRFLEKVR